MNSRRDLSVYGRCAGQTSRIKNKYGRPDFVTSKDERYFLEKKKNKNRNRSRVCSYLPNTTGLKGIFSSSYINMYMLYGRLRDITSTFGFCIDTSPAVPCDSIRNNFDGRKTRSPSWRIRRRDRNDDIYAYRLHSLRSKFLLLRA